VTVVSVRQLFYFLLMCYKIWFLTFSSGLVKVYFSNTAPLLPPPPPFDDFDADDDGDDVNDLDEVDAAVDDDGNADDIVVDDF